MTKLPGCVAAAAIAAALVTATPGFCAGMHGSAGGSRMGRQVFAGGVPRCAGASRANRRCVGGRHDPACVRHHRHFRNFAFVGGPFFYDYAGYGNYCWQDVWTPYGWQWLDACSGPYGYGY